MTNRLWLLAAVCAVPVSLGAASHARAAMLTNGGNFPYGGQICANAAGLGFTPGAAVSINPCHGYTNQQWNIELGLIFSDGLYKGLNVCLDVVNHATAPGSPVIITECGKGTPPASQYWTVGGGPAHGQIVNTNSGLCLDATNQAQGTQLVINTCATSGLSQQWEVK